MANLHRALVGLSDNLGYAINREADREHERVMAMRQENLMRIQAALQEQGRANDRAYDATERDKDRAAAAAANKATMDLTVIEHQKDRDLTLHEGEASRSLQREQMTAAQRREQDASYMRQLNSMDSRIQELSDYQTQAQAEGKVVDPTYLKQVQDEISSLQAQRRQLAQERDISLARSGDSRYRKLSPEEVAKLTKGSAPVPAMAARTEAPPEVQQPGGAQTIKMPPRAPDKPQGMLDRETRRSSRDRPAPAEAPQEPAAPLSQPLSAQDMARVEMGRGVSHPRTGRNFIENLFSEESATSTGYTEDAKAVDDYKAAVKAGTQPPPDVVARVNAMSPQRRRALGL